MLQDHSRNWREIATELTHTIDSKKIVALSEELDRAIQEQGLTSKSVTQPPTKSKSAKSSY